MQSFQIKKTKTFNILQTLESGQMFRFIKTDNGLQLFSMNHYCYVFENEDSYIFECDNAKYFYDYFDFDTNYELIQQIVDDKGQVSTAIDYGWGVHLLKQNPVETIICFIISQNNNIVRIKSIVDKICKQLGEKIQFRYKGEKNFYYAFPTIEKLASVGEDFYKKIGAGYRASYLDKTAKALLKTDINALEMMNTITLREHLLKFHGVGRKVADCILLFGFQRFDVFPVDTWILKVFKEEFSKVPAEKLSELLVEKYGKYSGYVQQWLFYFKRENKKL